MISSKPMPGNPWPREMVITIQDDSQALLDLLWLREAWELDPAGDDLPPRLVATPEPVASLSEADRRRWTDLWPTIWAACVAHASTNRDPELFERLHAAPVRSSTRADLLEQLVGPSSRDAFGDTAFPESHDVWERARFDERVSPAKLHRSPEREHLPDLIPAWRAGLTTLVVIPCRGPFTRRVGDSALLVTAETRDGTDFGRALRLFTAR